MNEDMTQRPISKTVLDTALGWMGICWSETGLIRLWLPTGDRGWLERQMVRHYPDAFETPATRWVETLVADLRRYAEGRPVDFVGTPVDFAGIDVFRSAIYAAARRLPYGTTVTYGELARHAGHDGKARETGAALGLNPVPIVVPCHRILAAGNKIGGFSAPGGSATKEKLLAMEGVRVGPPPPAQQSLAF